MASTSTADEFLFPRKFDFKYSPAKDEKVCVVAILGKSAYNSQVSKASPLNQIVDRQVFQGYAGQDLECYYDSESRVVYLHHWSVGDAARLTHLCQTLSAEQDITESLEAEGLQHAKTLLFLFSVSHLVVVNHPGASFDVSYIQLFNTINAIRLKWQPFITELLSDFPLPKDWILSGRPCSPRALFVFSRCLLDSDGRPGNQRGPSVRRLQHAVEDQIYRLLRKSRTITNISNNSLFAVPANQEFVYIHTKGRKLPDPVTTLLTQLRCHCPITQDNDSPRSPSFGIDRHGSLGRGDQSVLAFLEGSTDSSFKEFLEQHTQQALTKGFDDNVGRHPIPALFELCSCDVWFSMATSLYTAMFEEDGRLRSYYNNLGLLLNTDRRFSENRCSKVFPLAESTYQDGLPPHYTESYHQSKLAQARRVFCQHARGPCLGGYLRQLEESCTDWWRNGHQLCEAVSLTGHHCINRLHRVAGDAANSELEEMAHCSQYKTRAACNCGGIQADRPDPFTHRAANYEFYVDLEEQCCGNLDHTDLPVFRPSTSEVRAGESHDTPAVDPQPKGNVDAGTPILDPPSSQAKVDMLTSGLASLSLALSLDQASVDVAHSVESTADGETGGVTLNLQQPAEVTKPLSRQPSTVEYLPGMLNSGSSSGLLPLFPSWSVCGLPNKPSLYSTTQGLNQPGFLPGSNFLLPWDIPVMAEREKWPTVGEGVMRKGKQRRTVKETGDQTVRAYLGVEYECPRSHRFFCSGPEKIIKVSSNSTVKDNANKLLTMDMPLYCPCHCRSSKGLLAQLMRVYVLPPEGPVTLTVNPRVLPNPAPCPVFHPGSGHIQLEPGKIWVIRFPYMYLGPAGVYRIPSDPDQLQQCRLLQGMFEYTDHSEGQAKSG